MPDLNRRRFLQASATAGSALAFNPVGSATQPSSIKPPRVLFSNDTTNITSCVNPWRDKQDGVTDEHLRQTIREAAGADVHLLQPGLGWIPWWKSKRYSAHEHYEEFLKPLGVTKPHAYGRYLLAGGDLVETLTDECAKQEILPFVSYRLNDGHHTRKLADALEKGRPDQTMSRFYWENYERFRIGDDIEAWDESVFDWRHAEVRDHLAGLIIELCDTHDFAGLELDFLRHWSRFSVENTSEEERREITIAFVKRIRRALDRKTFAGKRRWLGIRVPARLDIHPDQGVDLAALTQEASVDFINLSYSYFTMQDVAVARARALVPEETAVYVEMTHTTLTGKALSGSGTQPYLRTTDAQFHTTAHLAYEQGATGVSFFNFAYYREHSLPELGPFHEPPFHVLKEVADPDFVARQPHCYFLSEGRNDPVLGDDKQLPALINRNQPQRFALLASPTPHHQEDGLLRFRSPEDISDRGIEVKLNGQTLKQVPYVAKPIDHPYDAWLGEPEEFACFQVPRELVRKGENTIDFLVTEGIRVKLQYLDLALPV